MFLSIGEEQLKCVLKKKPDHTDLLNLLAEYDYRWYDIGKGLHVQDRFLEGMKGSLSDKEKLSKILQLWMESMCSTVSWNKIKEVLESPAVNRQDIVSELSKFV